MIKANTKEFILREKLIKLALLQYKKEYIHGSHGPDSFDCAGFVWYLYHEILNIDIYLNGFGLSTTTRIMTSEYGKLENSLNYIEVGDVLFFHCQSKKDNIPTSNNKYPGHCGIFLDNNYFIHCTRKYGGVVINSLKDEYWNERVVGCKNVISYIK